MNLNRCLIALLLVSAASLTQAGLITAPATTMNGGVIQATQTASNAYRVSFVPPAQEADAVEKVYFALLLNGHYYFQTLDGNYHEWTGGEMLPMYEQAQSECRSGNSFSFSISFPSLSNLQQIDSFLPSGTAFYAGYGANQEDMVVNGKYAPVYVVPAK